MKQRLADLDLANQWSAQLRSIFMPYIRAFLDEKTMPKSCRVVCATIVWRTVSAHYLLSQMNRNRTLNNNITTITDYICFPPTKSPDVAWLTVDQLRYRIQMAWCLYIAILLAIYLCKWRKLWRTCIEMSGKMLEIDALCLNCNLLYDVQPVFVFRFGCVSCYRRTGRAFQLGYGGEWICSGHWQLRRWW